MNAQTKPTISLDTATYNRIARYAKVVGKTPEQVTANALNEWMEEWGEEILLMFAKAAKKRTNTSASTKVTPVKKTAPTCITSFVGPDKFHKITKFEQPDQEVSEQVVAQCL